MTPNHSEDTGDAMPNLTPKARTRTGYLLQESVSEGPR
jgi:hypothetical protein